MEVNYEEIVSTFVGEEYLDKVDPTYQHLAEKYMEQGGSARTAVGVAWYESSDEVTFEEISEELEISRRGLYEARVKLGLETLEPRGIHVDELFGPKND